MTAPPRFSTIASIQEFVSRLSDVSFWWPYVAEILERHDLAGAGREPVAGIGGTYSTFLYGDVVVTLFGSSRSWRESHAAERAAQARINPAGGPPPGPHNFFRGGPLTIYDGETRQAIAALDGKIAADAVTGVWEAALAATWHDAPVWFHGDVGAGNLLVKSGQLSAVIDFGTSGVGDPACDLSIAWTLFEGKAGRRFAQLFRSITRPGPEAVAGHYGRPSSYMPNSQAPTLEKEKSLDESSTKCLPITSAPHDREFREARDFSR